MSVIIFSDLCSSEDKRLMRLDLFLKKTRIIKTRTRSKTLCERKSVFLNNTRAKPGKDVKPDDIIKIDFDKRILIIEVIKMPMRNVAKSETLDYYRVLKDEKVDII